MSRTLDVYFHDKLTGKLYQNTNSVLSFEYLTQDSPAISISMPVREEIYSGDPVKAYFSGLLPEDISRHRLAKFLGISDKNPFALLEAIGGECAGALSLYPEGCTPPLAKDEDVEQLDNHKLAEILELLKRRPLMAGFDDLRLSLAGAQDKIAVGLVNNQIALIKGATPTTHILKPLIDNIKDSVHNEVFCMHLAKMMKIDVPETEIRWLGDTPFFLTQRYDRILNSDKKLTRLHQEDFCQSLSIMPELKYEREGGPGIKQCLKLLTEHSSKPAADQLSFQKRIIFNYLIGNADAHGKNFSLLYQNSAPSLAPAYDMLCTTIYPNLSTKMAMKIGNKYDPNLLYLRHWHEIAPNTEQARKSLEKELINMAKECIVMAQPLITKLNDQGIKSSIFNEIHQIIKSRSEHVLGQF